jgi:hypothetical protein
MLAQDASYQYEESCESRDSTTLLEVLGVKFPEAKGCYRLD